MGHLTTLILLFSIGGLFQISNGCSIEGMVAWGVPISVTILDVYNGEVLNRATTGVNQITVDHGSRLNGGPYVDVELIDSRLMIWTNDLYPEYERHETLDSMSITINYNCINGNTGSLVVIINVEDTNNNAPEFISGDELEFIISTPVPPGFLVTGCNDGITVQDIDLTTQRIDFEIEDNPLFEIAYDSSLSTRPKEFKALLRTKTLIRTFPEPITLRISATDVDNTNDPPITTYATIRIKGDTEFELPLEPVFSQTFYMATYSREHLLVHEPISLRQGFDDDVKFDLEGEYVNNFVLVNNSNQVSIRVRQPLPADVMFENQIFLIVKAERTYTSGASSTIIIQLPEVTQMEFEMAHYSGIIVDNRLQLPPLRLSQGYEGLITASITSDHSRYFTPTVEGNTITIAMSPLSENVILDNNFIYLQVVASTDHSEASTIVTLEIIKDDHITPVFERALYTGSYSPSTGLVIEPIVIVSGFDDTVNIDFYGDHVDLFNFNQTGPNINLVSSTLPPELYSEQQILLTIKATRPRTVGASAAIVITLPEARILDFEEPSYKGTLRDDVLTLETIVLSEGYDGSVRFTISGEHASYFEVLNEQNLVSLRQSRPLPAIVITDNSFIVLTLGAEGLNAVTTTVTILLEIIKEDISTPLFSRNIYHATYRGTNDIDIENIMLRQGYDSSVSFRIEGEHSQYFQVTNDGNNVLLSLTSAIPPDVIFREKVLYINILADKELTVGANAALLIRFPAEMTEPTQMRFSQHTYTGSIENNHLSVENVTLSVGYETGTDFFLTGDYAGYFRVTNENNIVSVSLPNPLPAAIIEDNNQLILEIEARRERAVSVWTSVIIEIVRPIIEIPVFAEAHYRGTYVENTGLIFEDQITLSSGYDETVTFDLEGEFASFFNLVQNNGIVTITIDNSIPTEIINSNDRLLFAMVAHKPNSISARTAILIDIQKETVLELVTLGFERVTYVGTFENNVVTVDPIVLSEGYSSSVTFTLHGDLASHFQPTSVGQTVSIALRNPIPEASMPANGIIVLEVQASAPGAVTAHTTVVLTVVTESDLTPIVELVFSATHYTGTYTEAAGLVFATPITLSQGYDATVQFTLEGDDSQWFGLTQSQNSAILTLTNAIPAAVIANNRNLIFSVVARRPGSADTRSTIVIALTDEYTDGMSLLGFERVTYVGTFENNVVTVDPIVLSEGYSSSVTFTLHGDLASHFQPSSVGQTVSIALRNPIPEASMPANGIIVLEVQASAPGAVTAHTTVVLTVVTESDLTPIVELVFSATHYTGTYTEAAGLVFATPITLSQGYDATVQFTLEGDDSQWFGLTQSQNSAILTLTNAIPAAVIANNRNLIFSVVARRPGSADTRSTIVIALTDEYTDGMSLLGFERVTYVGTFENNVVTVDPIVLSEGYSSSVTFTLHGDLASHFQPSSVGQTVSIALRNPIPEASMPANGIIVLEVQASAPGAVTAHTTVVLTVVTESDLTPIVELVFSATHYTGTYTEAAGLVFATPITLSQGYDATVQFTLEGDDSQWFGLTQSQNSAILTLTNAIPAAVIANNRNLIFSVVARRPGSADTRSTIVIALTDEYTDGMSLLGFERVTYVGTFENNVVTVDPIVLSEGYSSSVTFTLHGDLASHFQPSSVGQTVSIALRNPIPEASMPANGIIVLEVQASAPGAVTAHTTVVLTVVTESDLTPIVELVFSATHYTGTYTEAAGLVFATPITLSQGYDATVQFTLEGDDSQWFGLTQSQNSAILTLTNAIPAAVIANNRNLIFSVVARRPGSADTRSTIVIALTDEYTDGMSLLGFERVTYVGTFENNVVTVDPIVLSEGYSSSVTFTLHGDLASHFQPSSVGQTVSIALRNPIPEASMPANGIIVLEVQASAPGAVTAHTTVVLTVVTESDLTPIVELVFSATHYTGTYTEAAGLVFATPITLSQGYDATVQFTLEGDDSQWFGLTQSQNSAILTLTNAIPAAVIANNRNLIFSVVARRPGSADTRSTIVIALTDEYTDGMSLLGFERVTYVGTFENNVVTVDPIVLSEGYSSSVTFTLHGDLASHFQPSSVGQTVSIALRNPIPEASMPANGIIVLEVQASAPGAVTAHTTVVLTVVTESDLTPIVELVFSATHYTGTYTEAAGLVFATPITLSQGYDATVQFTLEGDDSQWFGLTQSQNSAILTLTNAIPAAVIANNRNLIFSVVARRPGSADTRSTIVIALTDEYTDGMSLLGFERVTYVGTFENNVVTVDPIVLSEGYSSSVTFTLHGDLASHFQPSSVGQTVSIALRNPIPEASMPANGIIVLEVQASAPGAVTAHTTVVLTVVTESDLTPIVELVFSATHYTGTYTEAAGLVFATPITLSQGYDATVQFTLEGDDSQWFGLTQSQNSAILTLTNAIPAAVIANNRNLIFSVVARRPGSADTRSTIVIALTDEYTDGMSLLGFERVTYVGTFENNVVTVDPIVLSEGYSSSVTFTLHGDLASHFQPSSVGQTVSIALRNPIPEASMPANGIIVLEVQASAPGAVTAHTTVVLTVATESDLTPIVELVFSATHYTGTYTEAAGLVFATPITLSQGYDATVQFTLEGDDSQWFGLTQSQNSAILTLTNAIPAAVIANNRNLIFSVVARRPGSADTRSTIVIALTDEYTDGMSLLGFERVTYVGTFENNVVTVDPIVLSEGYSSSVTFTLHGDLASHFQPSSVGQTVSIALRNPIPEASMPANGIIVLEVQASAPGAVTAHTTVVLTVVTESDLTPIVELVFSATHYTGTYTEAAGLVFATPITLSQGYDATVQFTLEGDDSQWFGLTQSQNSAILTLTNAIPAAVIANNRNLIFSVVARRPGSADTRSTIVIALTDEYTDGMSLLGFERVTYVGTFENNVVTVDPIVLSEGYSSSVTFTLHGDLASHFQPSSVGQTVSIALRNPIPEASMPANGIIVLEVQASAPGAVTAHTTVVLTVVTESDLTPIVELVFSATHYTGTYTEAAGLVFATPITLSQGYDATVQFTLEGDDSQWFGLTQSQNSAILTLTNAIPAAVIANNRNLIFSVVARRPGSADTRSTIVIALTDEYTDGMSLLGFERVTYVGTFENNVVTVDPIVLSEGYSSSVTFTLHGDLASHFQPSSVGQTVSIALRNPIPEASMPANGIIVLEVQASAPGAVTAHTTVVLTVATESDLTPIVELVFSATHYTGTYTEAAGLVFATPITLSQGYDATVQFTLEGDDSQWFGLTQSQNSAILTLTNAIPAAVIANNRNLIFSVVARRPGSADTRSTIVIALTDEYTDGMSLLGFERVTYVGTFENNVVTVDPIVLSEGYSSSVTFTLHGDLASHFQPSSVGQTVSIALRNPIPEASMPANGIIVLEVQASAPGAVTAHTTVVLTVVTESDLTPIVELVFSATHYTGTYTEAAGLVFATPITLSQGYDATVQFTLEGDDSQWFGLTQSQNSAILTLTNAIPAAVIANNRNLIFSVVARRPGSADTRSTIVIALTDEYTDGMSLLGFERVTYVGTFENNVVTVDPIVLSEGYSSSVTFTLHGDLASHFQPSSVGQTVSIALRNPIPEASMPANGIIVLEVQASAPGAVTAHTTVVLTVATESDLTPIVELVFSATHYTGTYTEAAGLVFATPITLSQGYDATVQFTLEGDDSQWFGLTQSQNSAILTLTNAIPAAVIANNRNLIFSVVARRPGSADTRSTIVIALTDEYTDGMSLLGFERVTYVGTFENNVVTVDPIVLSEGYSSSVTFTLHGDLASHFQPSSVGQTVSIALRNPIPEASMPANGIIVLEVQASAPGAVTAHTTVVLTVVTESDLTPIVELVFSATHYTGTYTEAAGLVFATPITLSQGYDATVQFTLEGDDSQWFGLTQSQNSAILTLTNAIPAAVIANNRNLIFSVVARRPGSADTRSTIVIALTDEYTDGMSLLGFERVTYVGTFENNVVTVDPIVLSEGYSSSVTFTLHGDLASHFQPSSVGQTVSIALRNPIPEASMPANGIIVLEVQASAPGAVTAHTTVVLTVVTESDPTPIVELVFSATHYTGTYTEAAGLVFATPITLSQGYDATVQFTLEGDDSQWFGLTQSQNSAILTLTNAIPAAVIANNRNLIFSVVARRPGSADTRSTIVIALTDEYTDGMSLLGFERVTYVGTFENNVVTVDPIVLSEGYSSSVTFTLHGDLASHFQPSSVGQTVSIALRNPIPEASMPANGIIVLEVQASAPGAVTAHTTVVLTVVTESDLTPIVELVFSATHYTGTYTEAAGLVFATPITLSQGYDATVQFTLEGDDSQWFGLTQSQNSAILTLTNAIPAAVIANNRNLIFSVVARRPGSADTRSTIVIALTDEYTDGMSLLGFERVTYVGTFENNVVTVDPIVLSEGYSSSVTFTLHGDLASHFQPSSVGQTVSIALRNPIPEASMPANGIIVLEVQASAPGAVTAHTTVVLTVATESDLTPIVELVFSATHYTGTYTEAAGLVFATPITLSQGYDATVQFTLEGDDSQWFGLTQSQNSAILTLTNAIPAAVIANNRNLIFSVVARRPGSADTRSTIVIALTDEYTDGMSLLGFERVTYVGTFENNVVTVDPIVLSEGYSSSVTFTLHGDLASHFQPSSVGQTVSIALRNPIPEASMPANGIIVLEVQASAPGAVTAHTTVVLTVVTESDLTPIVELVFSATHYTGTYTEAAGLVFATPITLSQGYDATVQFTLEGDDSQWFGLTQSQNSAILTLTNAIPAAVIANNRNLIFSVVARRPGSADTRSTIVIALTDEYTDGMSLLGFERVTYVGTFENNVVTVDPIVLSEGYSSSVTFTLHGDLASHFQPSSVGQTVSIALRNPIPEASMPANGIIVLEVQASAPGAVTAHTTVVLTVATESDLTPIVELVFSATHYTGTYTEAAGLVFATPITLSQGYDATVQFTLEGDDSQWFGLTQSQNSAILTLTNAIPAAVIANNRNLIFSVVARRPGSADTRSTIVIALTDEYTDGMSLLGFERVTYVGTFENNVVTVDPIVLSEGYSSSVTFTLHGDLASHFQPSSVGQTVSIALRNPIPEASMPANGIIVLEVQASAPGAVTAHTTVVLTVVTESDLTPIVELVFSATHYTGTYTEAAGLVFATPITLSQGYDATVQFTLEGDDSQWFGLTQSQNSAILTLTNAIPAAVIANNRNLIFSVVARRPGSADTRSTIVIALTDEYTDGMSLLGFERVTYVGTFENNVVTVDPIVLSEGYSSSVTFTLHGDLASHFQPSSVGQTVSIALRNPIPEASMPANGIIVLEVQASAPGAVTAHTTVVLTVVTESDPTPIVELVFSATHYTGTYTEAAGLVFATPITLSQGYDATVQFTLEGDDSQWFGLTQSQNSAILTLTNAIPAAVIANNRNLIFSVVARRPGSADTRSTIVIALTDEYTDGMSLLGFERVTYVGTFENNVVTVDPIVLSEGYSSSVTFTLHGDLASHFQPSSVGQTVSIALRNPIPEASMPANGIIVLEVQASAPGAVTAHTTVVLTVVTESDLTPIVELVFSATHYTGTYTEAAGLVFATPITLSQGYDATVQFTLEGDDSQWFGLTQSQNSAILTLTNAIPAAVIANNRNLIFSVVARRPGSSNARATILISLNDDTNTELGVHFDRVLYDGIIRNDVVVHERILLEGYSDQNIEIRGEFSGMFMARVTNGEVFVQKWDWATVPNVNHIALELQVSTARAVLLLTVEHSGEESLVPVVSFSSPSYSVSVDNTQTGFVGRVVATADNGEIVRYSISSNDQLADRLSINDNGEIHLSAPAPSGVYSAVVIATTVFTQARAEATIHITVTTITTCGDNLVLPPLIILHRNEEAAHQNLVVINDTEHPGCRFTLTNRWPANQPWLYVDEAGLHTVAIDREHESIASMALSQVQVELTLVCNDENARKKRSLDARPEWLGPYDYGTKEWILTDTISYNPRRSFVNLIVNDINDHRPIFIGKENEPIVVGYPINDLVETIMPRSLAELQATDADVGINAALVYWSTEEVISVAPTSGFVHVRDGVTLENNTRLVIHATDRRGTGLSGSIEILVKLLNTENIVVLTVRDAFLDDEINILAELSTALGYDVKALRSTVIPDGAQAKQDDSSRKQRNTQPTGSSLQLYIYGMFEREPVSVDRLTADVNHNAIVAVTVASVVSLEDYLEGREICVIPGRDTGLMVATILLSILLFILIVLIAAWFILRRRKELNNYEEFSDQNSLASRNESLGAQPKIMIAPKPRLNINEIKKSERRLQDMLQASVPEPEVRPATSRREFPPESIIDMSLVDSPAPVVTVIQSIDKLKDATDESDTDEFGEVSKARRKSVVTFNENVERIIHVEDNENLSAEPDYEIYKL